MTGSSLLRDARRIISKLPFKPMLVITAACLLIREQYPFSNFPMYSSFSDSTYYVYLADGSDQPLSTYHAIGVSTATLKKKYESARRAELRRRRISGAQMTDEQRQALGSGILAELRASPGARASSVPLPEVLRLYEVRVRLADGQLTKHTKLIGEHR